jgi:hypothetical protein
MLGSARETQKEAQISNQKEDIAGLQSQNQTKRPRKYINIGLPSS